jgi:tetratricopeptide (TPR) repeat protein
LAVSQHHYDKADEYLATAIDLLKKDAISKKNEGLNDPQIANILLQRAQVAQNRQLPGDAAEYTRQALAIQEKRGATADLTGIEGTKRALALRVANEGDFAGAESMLLELVQDEETSPKPDAKRAEILDVQLLGNMYVREKKYSEAKATFHRAMDLIVKQDGPDARSLSGPMADLASLSADEGHPAEAEAQFKATIAFIEKGEGPLAFPLDRVLREYAWLLHTLDRKEEAQKLLARAATVRAAHTISLPRQPSQN